MGRPPVATPDLSDVEAAVERISEVIVRTPLLPLQGHEVETNILLKPVGCRTSGSFKLRGVYNWAACLTEAKRERGLSTASAGNTA